MDEKKSHRGKNIVFIVVFILLALLVLLTQTIYE